MNLKIALGFDLGKNQVELSEQYFQYINIKLAALGVPIYGELADSSFLDVANPRLKNHREKNRLLANYPCPADRRIQDFLNGYLKDSLDGKKIKLPINTFILDRHGLARAMSIPPDCDKFTSEIVESYRVKQGVLHNPKSDRRTTQGVFHVAEGGLPVPADKIAVPKITFARLFQAALQPPDSLMELPFTATQNKKARLFVSLLLRPTVCPEVPNVFAKKSTEIRFIAPGNLVSNLDFVESIFGNAGDPYLPENDSGLDVEHWTGHTGCVILAPHLIQLKKKDLGLPHYDQATELQRSHGMCWSDESEIYNNGNAFKITCRDEKGVMVTLIADNYFGYCKKEVKTQISYSSNLYGLSEEEHAGGAIAFPSYNLGESFRLNENFAKVNVTFEDIVKEYGSFMEIQPQGYGVDKQYPDIYYVPENAAFDLTVQKITWEHQSKVQEIKLLAYHTYIYPSGYKIHIEKQQGAKSWHLIGTVAEGTLCHKPCTVSGGGKSEISKSIRDAMIQGPIFTTDFHDDMARVQKIMAKNFSSRFKEKFKEKRQSRKILSPERSLGSVIKLFTPSSEFSDEYNLWLGSLPQHIKEIIFVIKRHYQPSWGENWRQHFSVDVINGYLGHELKYGAQKLVANYLRVGYEKDGSRRIYKLRQDYHPSAKIQVEDDITASIVVSSQALSHLNSDYKNPSVKLLTNCEYRLFQRPDDAIHRGYDKQAESDIVSDGVFLSNFEPLDRNQAKEIKEDAISFDQYTAPVQDFMVRFIEEDQPDYFVAPSHPRIVEGKPSKNPRYLQDRLDIKDPRSKYIGEVGTRFYRRIPVKKPLYQPVNAVLPGRRNNPPDEALNIRPLAVYNPIHFQELPELFMDFICSVTGKSPSTTGFGSEGALTKGPFNALMPVVDLNNALVSYILTQYHGFSSAAGYIGPQIRVDHDISLLIPEIWCRMNVAERDPYYLIKNGYLEKLNDFEHNGRVVKASLLGYRINIRFVHAFLGRIFNNPNAVFSTEMLQPEIQALDVFADGMENIVATQKRVAQYYFSDGGVNDACPPLKALLHIMAHGSYEGKQLDSPEVREMFTFDYLIGSDWYEARLATKQKTDIELWKKHSNSLRKFMAMPNRAEFLSKLALNDRLALAKKMLESSQSTGYRDLLQGTIGSDPSLWRKSKKMTQKLATSLKA